MKEKWHEHKRLTSNTQKISREIYCEEFIVISRYWKQIRKRIDCL